QRLRAPTIDRNRVNRKYPTAEPKSRLPSRGPRRWNASNWAVRPRSNYTTLELQREDKKLGFHRNRVTSFPSPTKRLAASRRSVRACESLERFWPQPSECCRCEQRVDDAIEKMLERDHPAAAAPNGLLDMGCAVSKKSDSADDTEYLQEDCSRREQTAGQVSGKNADHHTIQKPLDQIFSHRWRTAG